MHVPLWSELEMAQKVITSEQNHAVTLLAAQVKRTLNFGDGQRTCIGMPLAKLILPTNLALLLSEFSFRLAGKVGA